MHFINKYDPDLIFLSEPQIHSCNLDQTMKYLQGSYKVALNTADKLDPELPLFKSKATGGTAVLWKSIYDAHVSVHPVESTAFLPIIFQPPGCAVSVHIAVYLPTLGQESQFLEELSKLSLAIEVLSDDHPDVPIYLRGILM